MFSFLPAECRFQHVEHLLAADEPVAVEVVYVEAELEKGVVAIRGNSAPGLYFVDSDGCQFS